ncbi:MAG: hypothetical protein ABMB14_08455 [Myxococcota bacterium]
MTSALRADSFRGRVLESPSLLDDVRLAVGAVHRFAWQGLDEHGDRARALAWLREAVLVLDGAHPGPAALLDWWLVVAVDQAAVQPAWNIDRVVGAPAGDVLKRILESGDGLQALRRPARFREVLEQLKKNSDRNPGKISGDKAILGPANDECKRLLRAAKEGEPPPTDLRLLSVDEDGITDWASEGPTSRRVEPGTPVWDHLVKQLTARSEWAKEAIRLWPRPDRRAPIGLPAGWEAPVTEAAGDAAPWVVALVQDALPEPPERPLLDPETVREALRTPDGRDTRLAFLLAREAWADTSARRPAWLVKMADRYDQLAKAIDDRDYSGDAGTWLKEAREELQSLDLDAAAGSLNEADTEHRKSTQGAELERRLSRARRQVDELTSLGRAAPSDQTDALAWAVEVEGAWNAARAELDRELSTIGGELALVSEADPVEAALETGRTALHRHDLVGAQQALRLARERSADLRDREERRLGPELAGLRARVASWAPSERSSVLTAIERTAARRDAGLRFEPDLDELDQLIDAIERKMVPAAVSIEEPGARPLRVAWVLGGVKASGDENRPYGARIRGLRVSGVTPSDGPHRVAAWGEVVAQSDDATGSGPLFRWLDDEIVGPYALRDGVPVAEHEWCAVASLPEARFTALFGLIDLGRNRSLVPRPPSLPELLAVGGTARDLLDDAALAAWLAAAVDGAPPPAAIERWLAEQSTEGGLPSAIIEGRTRRMSALLATAEALATHRAQAVRSYLASADGQAAVAVAAEGLVDREVAAVQEEVERRRVDLESSLQGARAELADLQGRLQTEAQAATERLDALQEQLRAADELLSDRKLKLIAELGFRGGSTSPDPRPTAVVTPIRSSGFEATDTPDLPRLIQDLAGGTWGVAEVTNLLLSLVTGRWTLLAGLPGVGKSTFVRSILSRLGHGQGTERYLELVVRRDWQDDAALFGFWHPTERSWTPSSEGFVEHLLRARDDERLGHGGIWPVLIEELNLASPEYYLARPISAFEAASPEVRLYDPAVEPVNAARYPASFVVPDSVRLVATVNVDDTVERLSPRFLSRASVIWVEPRPGGAPWRPEDDAPHHRVRWSALRGLADRAEVDLGRIEEVVRFLQEQRIPGAPTVRTQRAIGRYLGASRGLLPASEAEDLQILQRVLPPVRGTGPRWRGLLDRLGDLLARNGWKRSAERTRELRERGEELGDWYDFFHA